MDNKVIGERIKQARTALNLTQSDIAKELGLNKSTIQRYETGNITRLKLPILHAIANILNVNPDWLVGYDVPMQANSVNHSISQCSNILPITMKKIPLLGDIACGKPIYANEDKENYIKTETKADFCLKAKGDSMINARIYDGDIVFIKKQEIVDNGEIAAVIINDEATLKRVYYDRKNTKLVLSPENPKYSPLVYVGTELEQIRILGKAIAFQSNIK